MIVILHGTPGDDNRTRAHEITAFEETITIKVMPILGMALSRIINPATTTGAAVHDFVYRFKYHDGKHYHYQFVSDSQVRGDYM